MTLPENLARLILAIQEDPNHDLDEIREIIIDTPSEEFSKASDQFISLCHGLTESLVESNRSVSGIYILTHAIAKLQHRPSQLTAIHVDLCLLCLDSKCLNPAIPFLDTIYTDIKKTNDPGEDAKNVMLFYYYGGLIYAAVKNFDRALYFLEVVVAMPATSISPIMQEAFRKLIVINLILHGKISNNVLPKYASSCVFRQKKQMANQYLQLAHDYATLNHEKISQAIRGAAATYDQDENMGLVKQCLTQVHKRNIQRLTKTFLTLSLRDVANHVGLSSEREAEKYILNMIDDGEIFATINQKDGMVVFQDSSETFDSVDVFQKIQKDMSVTMNLISIIKKMDPEKFGDEARQLALLNHETL